ncbi:hypothetical protein [Paraburkholderia sp.]|uniref:hypothetical protein n=1 Tax=Paraburkholderia sp. TaxID=1926495 RepID=UPI0025F9F2C8|nr:hypothetical protein [Paraburkholderia sp.]
MIRFPLWLPQRRKTLAGRGIRGMPTLPIIGRLTYEWNIFSIFIYGEILIASASVMTYSSR